MGNSHNHELSVLLDFPDGVGSLGFFVDSQGRRDYSGILCTVEIQSEIPEEDKLLAWNRRHLSSIN